MAAGVTPRPRRHGGSGGAGLCLPGAGAAGGGQAGGGAAGSHAQGEEEDGRGAGQGWLLRQCLQHTVGHAGGCHGQGTCGLGVGMGAGVDAAMDADVGADVGPGTQPAFLPPAPRSSLPPTRARRIWRTTGPRLRCWRTWTPSPPPRPWPRPCRHCTAALTWTSPPCAARRSLVGAGAARGVWGELGWGWHRCHRGGGLVSISAMVASFSQTR